MTDPGSRAKNRLTAISELGPAPTFGGHRLTEEQALHYHMSPGGAVRDFKRYLKKVVGVEIPESAGSFVGEGVMSNDPPDEEWMAANNVEVRDVSDDPELQVLKGDGYLAYKRYAFMMPKDEVPDFIEHLNDCGAAIEAENVAGKAYSMDRVDPRAGRVATTYDWSEGGWQATFAILTPAGDRQTIYIGINPAEGTVFYASTVDDDD